VARRLGQEVSPDAPDSRFLQAELPEETPLSGLWLESMVRAAHQRADREYWKAFGWDDAVIDRFLLGKGTFHGQENLHILPMKLERALRPTTEYPLGSQTDWYIATRGGDRPYRSPGSVRSFWWHIVNDPLSRVVILAEGEKDAISLAWLFPEHNVLTTWGAASWTKEKTVRAAQLYSEMWVMGDNDDAGRLLNSAVFASNPGMTLRHLDWGVLGAAEGCDVTDYLSLHGYERTRRDFLEAVRLPEVPAEAAAGETSEEIVSWRDLRDPDSPHSLYRRVVSYYREQANSRPKGLLLAAPPGAGKSRALVQFAQETARAALHESLAERTRLMNQVDELRNSPQLSPADSELLRIAEKLLENFSLAKVAWYGQYRSGFDDLLVNGMDAELCFNFEARSSHNCANFDLVRQMSQANHDIGGYCRLACPYREQCERDGYLAQLRLMREKPITFLRHEHLTAPLGHEYDMVIVDENPAHVYDSNPLRVTEADINPHTRGWEQLSADQVSVWALKMFVSALRAAVLHNHRAPQNLPDGTPNPDYMISGARFIRLVDGYLQRHPTPTDIASVLDVISPQTLQLYQPNFHLGDGAVRLRCVADIYRAFLRETPAYVEQPDNDHPSCLHCVSGVLEVYPQPQLRVLRRARLIVADATAHPTLCESLFRRPFDICRPRMHNPNCRSVIIRGSDFTKGQVRAQLGEAIASMRRRSPSVVSNLLGETFNLDELLSFDVDAFTGTMVEEIVHTVRYLREKHPSLLVVTHKDVRILLEAAAPLDGVFYAHYGALRGTNIYENCQAVLAAGAYRQPYDVVWRKVQAWANRSGIREKIPYEMVVRETDLPIPPHRVKYRSFTHPFAEAFADAVEVSEVVQSIARIRPHSTDDAKYIYLMANRPILERCDEIWDKRQLMARLTPNGREANLYTYLLAQMERSWLKNGVVSLPSLRQIRRDTGHSIPVIKRVLEVVDREFRMRYFVETEREKT
jgi:hypothetical protein